ncbi:hypothetical protein EI94DRAFT_1808248 [Lactarius quietus]|nr:hypothetical protein EI94DRAFT_1808248 [Lactarius quietus]
MLQSIIFEEREHGQFTRDDFLEVPGTLSFGPKRPLSIDYNYVLTIFSANDAFRHRGGAWELNALEKWVPLEIEDGLLIAVFSMWVEDQLNQVDRMREAVIARFP